MDRIFHDHDQHETLASLQAKFKIISCPVLKKSVQRRDGEVGIFSHLQENTSKRLYARSETRNREKVLAT